MSRDTWFPRSLVVLLMALLGSSALGGACAVALGASGTGRPPAGVQRAAGQASAVDAAPSDPGPWVDPDLLRYLERAEDDAPLRIIVVLRMLSEDPSVRLTLEPAIDRDLCRARYVQAKRARFTQARVALSPLLADAAQRGLVVAERELWLVDALGMTVHPELLRDLMASPAVAEIYLDHYRRYVDGVVAFSSDQLSGAMADPARPWGLDEIRAPEVWHTLAVSGTGSVVAVMDTGVDWQHQDLYDGYRGNLGKEVFLHSASWYDAVNGGTYPYDDHGHGTHVAGTAAGYSIGVAPGASWIGVKVLNGDGYGYDSWILGGFQWLLAPGGDPGLAPDVVNGSWSSSAGGSTVFLDAIVALEAAGVFPVFAAGNAGPEPGSVGSPGSNPGVFAVGASDSDGDVPAFSGRGPSFWDEIKPVVAAPGVNVVSALPGGIYGAKSGTSMATPHVAGLGALVRGVSPTVPVAVMARIITETARPLTATVPGYDSGWGQIDALAALVVLTDPALITGTVADTQGRGLDGATVTAWPDTVVPGETPGTEVRTDVEGRYTLALRPGRYAVRAQAFGYQPHTVSRVDAVADEPVQVDYALAQLPTGDVHGQVSVVGRASPPTTSITIRALGTPVETTVAEGAYHLTLPSGVYTLEVRGMGYRVVTGTVDIVPGEVQVRGFVLEPAPGLLLVDEGAWYYGSQIAYWTEALDALRYAYDQVRIKVPESDTPVSSTLALYDVVLWSSPIGSPGLVGAGSALTDYLDYGGRLLVSGQDVAYLDGGGSVFRVQGEPYLLNQMGVGYVADRGELPYVIGAGPFGGMTVSLEGGTGADNQSTPDVVAARDVSLASSVWHYGDGGSAGVAADICVPYRSLFLAFGLEGISDAAYRQGVLQRSIDWLTAEPPTTGLTIAPVTQLQLVGTPGEHVTHVVKIRHIGVLGTDETVTVAAAGADWPTEVSLAEFQLQPCTSASVTVTVTIPPEAGINTADVVSLAVSSDLSATPVTLTLTTKTPAPVLLVDDDRWYPVEDLYVEALATAGVPYDLWDTRSGVGGAPQINSPDEDSLGQYPIVLWFTGYDWYAPIEAVEADRLLAYLDQGGRLLLSSQDFAYHHEDSLLADRLGILLAEWTDKVTGASGVTEHPAGGSWGSVSLSYPFPNWSHTVEPAPKAAPVARGQIGQPAGIATGSPGDPAGQTLFHAFPLESLPLEARSEALSNAIGWLSPLGSSQWTVSPTVCAPGDPVTFTLVLHNSDHSAITAASVHRVPEDFAVIPGQLPSEMDYDPISRELSWSGSLAPDVPTTVTWPAVWMGVPSLTSSLQVTLTLPAWGLSFSKMAPFYGAGPDLTSSDWLPTGLDGAHTRVPVSLTFALRNESATAADDVALSLWMMQGVSPITISTPLTRGWALASWSGNLAPFEIRTTTVQIQGQVWELPLRVDALLTTATGHRWEDSLWLAFDPWQSYLPVVMRVH